MSPHHSDQMSEESEVSKVTICVKILKWQFSESARVGIELPGQLKNTTLKISVNKID